MGRIYRDEKISTELMTTTVAKPQGVKLKEADSKLSGPEDAPRNTNRQ
jgi:hypothetical protein